MPTFTWPACGAVRDRHEMEYINVLAQSGVTIRENGTISAEDIQIFIESRHGLKTDLHLVEKAMNDLVGISRMEPQSQQDQKYLDIPSLTSLLLMSLLLRKHHEYNSNLNSTMENSENEETKSDSLEDTRVDEEYGFVQDDIFARVLNIILGDLPETPTHCVDSTNNVTPIQQSIDQSPKLTKELLRKIFIIYGEINVEDEVLEEMLTAPFIKKDQNENNMRELLLDRDTFASALTYDLHAYNHKLETKKSSYNQDFLSMARADNKSISQTSSNEMDLNMKDHEEKQYGPFQPIYTASNVDLNADRMQSDNFLIFFYLLVCVYTVAYFAGYGYIDSLLQCETKYTENVFGCHVVASIADWLFILLEVGVFGGALTFLVSASGDTDGENGRNNYRRNGKALKQTAGMVILAFFSFVPLYMANLENALFTNQARQGLEWASYFVVGLGSVLVYIQFTVIFRYFFPGVRFIYTPECVKRKEIFSKKACRFKVDKLYENAMEMHSSFSTRSSIVNMRYGQKNVSSSASRSGPSQGALLEFIKRENDVEPMTRLSNFKIWSLSDPMYEEEGVWVGTRIWAGNLGQMLAVFAFAWFIASSKRAVSQSFQNIDSNSVNVNIRTSSIARGLYFNTSGSYVLNMGDVTTDLMLESSLTFGYPFDTGVEVRQDTTSEMFMNSFLRALETSNDVIAIWGVDTADDLLAQVEGALFNATGINLKLVFSYVDLYNSFNGNFVTFVIEQGQKRVTEKEINVPIIVGGAFGILAMIFVTACYFPSGMAQILMLRHGSFKSPLTNGRFEQLRLRPFNATYLFAGAIWGVLATGVSTAVLIGSITFFAVWSETSSFVIGLVAMLVGLSVSLIIRSILICSIRGKAHNAFYRKKPVLSNILSVLLETWSFAVALGFILARGLKLIIATCFYLGRIDCHLLHPNVNDVNKAITIDGLPDSFTIDLLLHDAHRHPYLERLGLIYMLKIYKEESFASRAGCSWRLLFTLALCPWLRRYRNDDGKYHYTMMKKSQ